MSDMKKYFKDNVEKHATSTQRPIEYNEQRGFLALAEAVERMEHQLRQVDQELGAVRQELSSVTNRLAMLED